MHAYSAGIGRTGTFICIDNVLEQVKKVKVVDIAGAINKMRHQRMKMVQTPVSYAYHIDVDCIIMHTIMIIYKEQYIFLHDAVLESVTCGDTEISSANLRLAVRKLNKINPADNTTMLQTQFKVNRHQSLITYTFMAACMALSVGSGSDISETK